MQVPPARCAGLDVHKKTVVACRLIPSPDGQVPRYRDRFSTRTSGLLALDEWRSRHDVSQVARQSTGMYWRPVCTLLEGNRSVMVGTAHHIKAVPGRKTEGKDAEWLAERLRQGLLQPRCLPPLPVRILRDLTRQRTTLVQSRTQERTRLQQGLATATSTLDLVVSAGAGGSQEPPHDASAERWHPGRGRTRRAGQRVSAPPAPPAADGRAGTGARAPALLMRAGARAHRVARTPYPPGRGRA